MYPTFTGDDSGEAFNALLQAAALGIRPSERASVEAIFSSSFPEGWRVVCDAFSVRLSKALTCLRPRKVTVQYGVSRDRLTVEVQMVPLPFSDVSEQLSAFSEVYIQRCSLLCRQCGKLAAEGCGCKQPTNADDAPRIQVFSGPALDLEYQVVGRDDKAATRLRDVFRRVRAHEGKRLLRMPVPDWAQRLDALADQFPNFESLLQTTLRAHLRLRAASEHARLAPILLVGPPGLGKTLFASTLAAEVFGCEFAKLNIVEETNGSGLCGSSVFWSNSQPGKLFDLLARGPEANPLVLLDEIDKACGDARYDPLAGLYTLLEADTARHFEDQSVPDISIDASHVRWIATANSTERIPAALLTRMQVFHIELPSAAERSGIAQRMLRSLIKTLNICFKDDMPAEIKLEMGRLSQREVRTALEVAVGLALDRGESRLTLEAWRQARPVASQRTPLGFTA